MQAHEIDSHKNDRDEYLNGYEDGLRERVTFFDPHPTEAIALFLNPRKISPVETVAVLNYIKRSFPDNEVIALPDNTSLYSCSKDVLENIISMIAEIIEKL